MGLLCLRLLRAEVARSGDVDRAMNALIDHKPFWRLRYHAAFDFKALPSLPRARVKALAAGDWLDGGGNLIAIGNSGTGKTHVLCSFDLMGAKRGTRGGSSRLHSC
jgi:DNA replication protein DnaC